jgi:hypothetical protein
VVLLLAPVGSRLKEWAYAGFAITLVSALIANFAVGGGPQAWGFAAGTCVLWGSRTFSGAAWRPNDPSGNPQDFSRCRNFAFFRVSPGLAFTLLTHRSTCCTDRT